jgi:hypothetical protein
MWCVQEVSSAYAEEYGVAVLPDQYFLLESEERAVPLGVVLWEGSAEQILNSINELLYVQVRLLFPPASPTNPLCWLAHPSEHFWL